MWHWRRSMQLGWKSVTVMLWHSMADLWPSLVFGENLRSSCVVHCGAQINPHDLAGAVSLTKTSESLPGKGLSGLIVSDLCEESY